MKRSCLYSRYHILIAAILVSIYPVFNGALISRAQTQRDGRGLKVTPAKPVESLPTNSKRFALVIGVDEYEDSQINKLEGAGNDAKAK